VADTCFDDFHASFREAVRAAPLDAGGDFIDVRRQRDLLVVVCVVRVVRRKRAQCRLALHVLRIAHSCRLRTPLPQSRRLFHTMIAAIRWVRVGVVHLEFGGLEIPYAKREAPARREWLAYQRPARFFSADVAAEQRRHFAFVRAHNEQAAEAEHQQRNKDGARNDEPRRFRPDSVNNGQNRPSDSGEDDEKDNQPWAGFELDSRTTMRRLRKGYLSDIIMVSTPVKALTYLTHPRSALY